MKIISILLSLFCLVLIALPAQARPNLEQDWQITESDHCIVAYPKSNSVCAIYGFEQIPQENPLRKPEIIVIPFVFYSPDTSWGLGTGATYAFARRAAEKPSSLQAVVIYTELNQSKVVFIPDFYFGRNRWHWRSKLEYVLFPDEFYGLGPESRLDQKEMYVRHLFGGDSKIEYNWFSNLYSGVVVNVKQETLSETEDNPILQRLYSAEEDTGVLLGIGPIITWDSRDNLFYPTQGNYVEVKWLGYPIASGRDALIQLLQIDAKLFVSLTQDVIIGFQGVYKNQQGPLPITQMSRLGNFLRGYKENRYQDQNVWMAQTELRLNVYDPVKLHLFFGVGNIFSNSRKDYFTNLKFAGGIGLRYRISKDNLNIKFDVAFNREDSVAVYFGAQEAF